MKLKYIKPITFALLLALSFPVTAFAASKTGTQITKEVPGIKATLTFADEKLKTGNKAFTISFTDESGIPLSIENLQVTADMDRTKDMGNDGMDKKEPMMLDLQKGSQDGVYTGKVDLTNNGKWILNASFNLQSQPQAIAFDFDVMDSGPNWLIIGGFGGVILLILVIAVINKKSKKV